MKFSELSIADLKASYDFVLVHLKELEQESIKVGIKTETMHAYTESKELEHSLYTALLNKVLTLN